jgi:hypothetical protein
VSSGTPHNTNRPRASAAAEIHLGGCAPVVRHSALTVPETGAVESPATRSLPSTIPPVPYPRSPHAIAAICNALGTRTAIVVAPETVTGTVYDALNESSDAV